jgi:hypothetical protein
MCVEKSKQHSETISFEYPGPRVTKTYFKPWSYKAEFARHYTVMFITISVQYLMSLRPYL